MIRIVSPSLWATNVVPGKEEDIYLLLTTIFYSSTIHTFDLKINPVLYCTGNEKHPKMSLEKELTAHE